MLLATVVAALAMKNLVLTQTTKFTVIAEKYSKIQDKGNGIFLGGHFHRCSTNLNKNCWNAVNDVKLSFMTECYENWASVF